MKQLIKEISDITLDREEVRVVYEDDKEIEQLLTNYLQELIGEDEPDTFTFPDGHISTNFEGITRNQLRQQLRVKAGLEGKE